MQLKKKKRKKKKFLSTQREDKICRQLFEDFHVSAKLRKASAIGDFVSDVRKGHAIANSSRILSMPSLLGAVLSRNEEAKRASKREVEEKQ